MIALMVVPRAAIDAHAVPQVGTDYGCWPLLGLAATGAALTFSPAWTASARLPPPMALVVTDTPRRPRYTRPVGGAHGKIGATGTLRVSTARTAADRPGRRRPSSSAPPLPLTRVAFPVRCPRVQPMGRWSTPR
ncbi:hypothetical protein ABZ826_26400 [Streptomyces sp. NPDC047515]|uniref:hypothetical protein n=1 Tax=Streptomyces sp. NPDC047515 TaxID=3155380 RepID=UPI0033FC6F01